MFVSRIEYVEPNGNGSVEVISSTLFSAIKSAEDIAKYREAEGSTVTVVDILEHPNTIDSPYGTEGRIIASLRVVR